MAVRGIAAGAGTVLGGFLVLDQRGHVSGGGMQYDAWKWAGVIDPVGVEGIARASSRFPKPHY